MPQLHPLIFNGHKIKTGSMIKVQLMWIGSHTLSSEGTTLHERVNLRGSGEFQNIQAHRLLENSIEQEMKDSSYI
jgi:hypothetical protein